MKPYKKRENVFIYVDGEKMVAHDAAIKYKISDSAILYRLKRGLSDELSVKMHRIKCQNLHIWGRYEIAGMR
jgi:hypothetical protein